MTITLIQNWEKSYKSLASKVNPLGPKDREVIDKTFDKLYEQGLMSWSNEPTPFGFPCFVVLRTMPDGTWKGRAVVDIRALNKIFMPEAYPMPLQENISAAIRGCTHISTVDAVSFFYQWAVKKKHRHRLAVVLHRGQEIFNVAVIRFKNSPAYAQRMIDTILRPCRSYARAYVDNIVIFTRTLQDHVKHLRKVFDMLRHYSLTLELQKACIGYPSLQLLRQRVDALGLTTSEEKLKVINLLEFPRTLRQLEHTLV